jgi:hypothetical protein
MGTSVVAASTRVGRARGPEEAFWKFCLARQSIRRLKEAGVPRGMWTNDPVLASYFFTNVNRRHDPGTVYAIGLAEDPWLELPDLLFNVALYRAFNLIATHKAIRVVHGGGNPTRKTWEMVRTIRLLEDRRLQGITPFTGAFQVTGTVNGARRALGYGLETSAERAVVELLDALYTIGNPFGSDWWGMAETIERFPRLDQAYAAFRGIPGFGKFLAYQCALDVNYRLDGSEDEVVVLGPGAEAGLREVYGEGASYQTFVRILLSTQPGWIDPRMTLCDLEHALCEFSKYARLSRGDMGPNRRYTPGQPR